MAGLARRLRQMSRDEWSWRLRTQLRTHAEEAVCALRPPRWDRDDARDALAIETLPPEVQAAAAAGDWRRVHAGLHAAIATRPSRFVLNAASATALRRAIAARWPRAQSDAVRRAAAVTDGSFDLLGYRGLSFDSSASGAIDWHFDPVHGRRMPMAFWSRVPYLDPRCGDHKVVWELNRHQHWLTLSRALWLTGDSRWAHVMTGHLTAWLSANPPLVGANWSSMLELAFRSISWMWGLHAMVAVHQDVDHEEPWIVDLLVALDRHLTHVEHNLSRYFSPNTHLTGEALALYVGGAALPELRHSARWIDVGREVLLSEIDRQIEPDGGHAERSTHYHRYTLDFYLLALQTARRLGDMEAEQRFSEALGRIVPFALAMADRQGRLPLIGDDDAGRLWPIAARDVVDIRDSLGVAAAVLDRPEWAPWGLTEEVLWLTCGDPEAFARALRMDVEDRRIGERRTLSFRRSNRQPGPSSTPTVLPFPSGDRRRTVERRGGGARATSAVAGRSHDRTTIVFASTGYVTSATAAGDHLVFDVGRHGYLNGGHAHADALALVLSLRGQPLLVDPGTPTYTMDRVLRDQLRSSASHNTLTIDGVSSAVPDGPFHWQSRTDAELEAARFNTRFALLEARHDGYVTAGHRRVVFASDLGYVIADQITGAGNHEAAQHWHFDPHWQVRCEAAHTLRMTHDNGSVAWLVVERGDVSLITADPSSSLGWCSPAYGVRIPSWTARVTQAVTAPSTLVSWCGLTPGGGVPWLERIPCESDVPGAMAIRMTSVAPRAGVPGVSPGRSEPADARELSESITMLCPGDAPGRRTRLITAHRIATDARALQCGFVNGQLASLSLADGSHARIVNSLTVESDQPLPDLHIACDGRRLELTSTMPPGRLRLEGKLVERVQSIVSNGRELPRRGGTRGGVVLTASDWTLPNQEPPVQDYHDVRNRRVR